MLEQTPKREAGTAWVGSAYQNKDRSRMSLALVLLLVALSVVLVKDRESWFGDAERPIADETSPEWVPSSVVPATAAPVAKTKKHVAAAKSSAKPAVAEQAVIATRPTLIRPLEVEVAAGDAYGTFHLGSNSVKIEMPPDSRSGAIAGSMAVERGPATFAAERVPMSLDKTQDKPHARPQPIESSYPLLGRQMKVQGSVLLQALIGADGVIRSLRVLSGPAILASAAREAARRWQFKPYWQNGQPVETQANMTVNFTIKVLENGARDRMDTVVALSSRGE